MDSINKITCQDGRVVDDPLKQCLTRKPIQCGAGKNYKIEIFNNDDSKLNHLGMFVLTPSMMDCMVDNKL